MNSRFKVSNISQFSNSPIHIGPSIQTAHNSNDTINGGEYRIKVQVHDKTHLNEINSNLDYLKQRNSSLKKAIENRLIEINKANQTKFRRASMPILYSIKTPTREYQEVDGRMMKHGFPRLVCKSLLLLALIMLASFSALTIMEGIGIKLSTDIKDVSSCIDNTSFELKEVQHEMMFFIQELNKTLHTSTTSKPTTSQTTTEHTTHTTAAISTLSTSINAVTTTTQPGKKLLFYADTSKILFTLSTSVHSFFVL